LAPANFRANGPVPDDEDVGTTIDISKAPIHLGLGGAARAIEDFDWSAERLAAYEEATRADGADGRMVMMFHSVGPWTSWERHPLGAEVVIACTGTHRFVQELDNGEQVVELGPGQALINPPVWHTADSGEGGWIVTITPGAGTEHRPR
jgi:hypothetical protein